MDWKLIITTWSFVHLFSPFVFAEPSAPVPRNAVGDGLKVPNKDLLKDGPEYEYRLVNWCIVGQGEHLLYRWPFSQLKHFILQANFGFRKFEDNNKTSREHSRKPKSVSLEFNKINCQKTKDYIGDGSGNYYHRAHVVIKSDVPFQGLVIQANHAPFGVGFPFGQFDVDSEFECSDCLHGFGKVIPCISRPDISLMHPTVGAFHYMYTPPWTRYPVGQQNEVHFNFKWAHTECSSARIVEFWVLIILDFDRSVWIVEKFGPYEFQPYKKKQDAINPNDGYQTRVPQPFLPSPILPRCMPLPIIEAEFLPKILPPTTTTTSTTTTTTTPTTTTTTTTPTPKGRRRRQAIQNYSNDLALSVTREKRQVAQNNLGSNLNTTNTNVTHLYEDLIEDRVPDECFREYGTKYNATMCYLWKERRRQIFMMSTEPPADDKVPGKPIRARLISHIKCEGQGAYFGDDFNKKGAWSPIRLAKTFDTDCITYYNKKKGSTEVKEFKAPYKVCENWQAKFVCQDAADWALNSPWPAGAANKKRYFPLSRCTPCPTPEPTKPPEIDDGFKLIRREEHGGLMIAAFLLIFPVAFIIARFYKETIHKNEVKGFRTWLVIHVVLSLLGMIIIYVGYCCCRPSHGQHFLHNILGYAAASCCVIAMFSGWVRNKGTTLLKVSIFVHAAVGYAGWALGLASLILSPVAISKGHKLYFQLVAAVSGAFTFLSIIILTINIIINDRQMEMQPRRPHLPIVEIRFDRVTPHGQLFRKIFLGIFIFFTFVIFCAMLTVPWLPEE